MAHEQAQSRKRLSFDAWNQLRTIALVQDNPGMGTQIRRARTGGMARLILWDDYQKDAAAHGYETEEKIFA